MKLFSKFILNLEFVRSRGLVNGKLLTDYPPTYPPICIFINGLLQSSVDIVLSPHDDQDTALLSWWLKPSVLSGLVSPRRQSQVFYGGRAL